MANIELPITKTKASHRPLPFRQAHSQLVKNMWCHPHSDPHYAQPELLYMLTHERVLRRHLLATYAAASFRMSRSSVRAFDFGLQTLDLG